MQIGNRRKVNRLVCLLLVLCMMLGAIPTNALAEGPEQETPAIDNSISGVVWLDENGDGLKDSGEQPIKDFTVRLVKSSDKDSFVATTKTDSNGKYEFSEIEPGDYLIFAKETGKYAWPSAQVKDSTDNKVQDTGYTKKITIEADSMIKDIGIGMLSVQPLAAPLSEPVESGEPSEGPQTSPEPSTAPEPSPEPSTEPEESAEPSPSQSPEPSESPEPTESAPAVYENSINGMLWLDMFDDFENSVYAGDGVRQTEEQPLAGYKVELFKADDLSTAVQAATTDANGKYRFENLEPGSYIAGVKTETVDGVEYLLPLFYLDGTTGDNRFVATLDEDADAYIYAYTKAITVEADSAVTGMDAGMRTVPQMQMLSGPYDAEINLADGTYTGDITGITIAAATITFDTNTNGKNYRLYGTTTARRVVINTGVGVNITLDGADITASNQSPFRLEGTANVNLTLEGTNFLVGASTYAGLFISSGATLIIDGSGLLDTKGGNYGAGIGGNSLTDNGTVIINSGTITATGGNGGPGIGGGFSPSAAAAVGGKGGTITINGGTITAIGSQYSPGIGGGGSAGNIGGNGGAITITGGTITATGGNRAPGIGGGGSNSSGALGGGAGTISIAGGRITATAGVANIGGVLPPGIGVGVGQGGYGTGGTIIFTGGSILPKNNDGTVSVIPSPRNGTANGNDVVTFNTIPSSISGKTAGQRFVIEAIGSARTYLYPMLIHHDGTDNAYPWAPYNLLAPEAVTNAATSVSTTGATLNGTYNTKSLDGNVYYEYGTTSGSYTNTATYSTSANSTSATDAPKGITGLSPNTTYYFRIVVESDGGETSYGAEMSFTTGREVVVTFDPNGGSAIAAPVTYASTDTFGTLPTTTQDGYTFDGWYDSATGGTKVTSTDLVGTVFSGSTGTLYAQWTENSYTVAFDSHGGTTTPSDLTRTYSQALGTLPTVAQPGYTFNGWYTAATGGTQVSSTSTISVLSPTLANGGTLTLHAQWSVNNNTVTFDTRGGSPAPADLNITAVTPLGTLTTPTKTGYDFAGWWTTPTTGGTQANATSTPIGLDSTLADNATLTLYARWSAISYQIDVEYETRTGGSVPGKTNFNVPAAYDSTYAPSTADLAAPTGYVLVGWKLNGTLQTGTTPSITVSGDATITLIYGLDRGATGNDPTDPATTPDGIEDIVVTREWYDTVGGFNMYPPGEQGQKVINVGDTFAEAYTWLIGYEYQGYKIDGGALQTGSPSIAIAAGDSDFTITYVYARQNYQVQVNYELRNGSAVPGTTNFARSAGYGTTYAPTAAEQQVTNYVMVDWLWNGTSMNNTSPSITVPLGGATITLVYGRDSGTSGDPGGSGTRNGVEDFDITRKWEMSDGSAITGLSSEVQIWDVGDSFNVAHNTGVTIPSGLDYQGYRLSTDATGDPLHSGTPNYTVNTTDGDVTVTYVYSKVQYAVTVHFVDRAGSPIGSPTTATAQVDHGDPYTATAQTISGYTFVDWKIGSAGTLAGNTSPTVSSITSATDIYLVYGRDSGTTGDINGGGSETPNGKEDFDVTRMWQMQGGGAISGLGGQVVIMDVGDSFTMAHNSGATIPAGLTYEGYRINGGSLQTGTPNEAVTVAKGNFTVTYEYSTTQYTVTVNYEDRAGTQLQSPTTSPVAHGQNYTPTDPGFANKVLVGWYSGAPTSNPTVLNLPATLTNVTGSAEITLVYGKDNVKDDGTTGTDGVEDFTIIKKWETTTSTTLHGPISMDLNVGKVFNTAHNADVNLAASGWTYQGYYLSTDAVATLHAGVPNVAVSAANGDFTVTYVYARTTFSMTVNYADRNAVTQQASINPSAVYGDPFQPAIPVISGKVYVGWYLGAPSTSKTVLTTTPEIDPVTGAGEITLVYGKDNGGGGTATPDGTEDFDVTREWKMQNGTAIAGLSAVTEPWNAGETFNKAHNVGVTIPTGLTYAGFKYDTDAAGDPIRTGTPSILITVAGGDRGVTYYYTTTGYTVNVSYEYLSNAGATSSLPGGQTAGILHGSNFNTTSTPALLVPNYLAAPGTTDPAFQYKTYIGYKVDGGTMQLGLPALTNVTAGHNIVLVYAQDMNENGTRDYTITETHKSGATTLATNTVYVDAGAAYNGAVDATVAASGYTYDSYAIVSGASGSAPALPVISNVQADATVNMEYALNGYAVGVTYRYDANSGSSTALTGSQNVSINHGDNFNAGSTPQLKVPTAVDHADFDQKVLIDWELDGVSQGNTTPGILNVIGPHSIVLVFAQDMDRDGTRDYTITEKFQTEAGGTIMADNEVYVNENGTYTMADPDAVLPSGSGAYYTKYNLDGGADSATAVKPVSISTVTADHTVIYKYLPNEYTVSVVYEYHKNDGTVQVLGTGQTESITHGNAFDGASTPALAQPAFPNVVYSGWKLNGVTQTGNPGIASVTNAATITLVYYQDMDGDGTRDYTITEKHVTPNVADNTTYSRYINEGDPYSASTDSTVTGNGYTYTDYAIVDGTTTTGLAPALPSIAAVNTEYTVTLNYARTLYTVNVTYEYKANNGSVITLPGSQSVQIAHGGNFDATVPVGNELVIPDYLSAPGTTDPAFQYKTLGSWTLDGAAQTGTPGLTNVTGSHNIVLVYAQDMDEDGTPDITVTKQFINGHTTGTLKAAYDVYVNIGTLFNDSADAITGWTYDHHTIDGGAASAQYALPSFTPALGDADKVVTYVYYDVTAPAAPVIDTVGDSDTVVTGTGDEPGNTITVTWPDSTTSTATVQPDGTWSVNVPGSVTLDAGDTLSATETDPYNNVSGPGTTTVIDNTPPAAPVINTVGTSDTTVTGTGDEPGNTITITWPDNSTSTTTVLPDGTWSVSVPGSVTLAENDVLSATETDPSSNVSGPGTTTVIDNTPPAAPVIDPVGDADTVVTGTGDEPGNTITVTWPDNSTSTTVVKPDGTWEINVPGGVTLTENDVISATETDTNNNVSGPGTTTVYDNTPPAPPVINTVGTSDTTVTGTGDEPGNTITITWPDNTTSTTTVQPDGTWSVSVPGTVTLAENDILSATETDPSSNVSGPGTTTVIDNTAPAAPVVDPVGDADTKVTGTGDEPGNTITVTWPDNSTSTTVVKPDGTWEINVPGGVTLSENDVISATETDPSNNVSGPGTTTVYDNTPPAAPVINTVGTSDTTVTGTGDEPGNTITITWPDNTTSTTTVQPDGTWSVNVPGSVTLAENDVLSATETDPSSNVSGPGTTTVQDTTPPAAPVIDPVGDSDTKVTGTGDEPGNTITVTWPDNSTSTTVVKPDGTWEINVPGGVTLTENDVISATETDPSNNVSGPGTETVYDNTPPAAPVINPVKETDTKVTGTGDEPGNTITVTWPDNSTSTTVVKPDGTWEINVPGSVTLSPNDTITATETDSSSNVSSPGNAIVGVTTYLVSVTYEYHANDGSVTALPGNQATQVARNSNFTANIPTVSTHTAFDQKVLIGWTLDGGTVQTGTPQLNNVTQGHTLVLIFAQDMDRDGTPDITVTKEFLRADGTVLKPAQTVYVNQGSTFADAHDAITGYDYQGYKLDGGSQTAGKPSFTAAAGSSNRTVSYIYTATQYTIKVKVVNGNGNSINNGSYDWTASKSYKESFNATAPTIQGYTYLSWKLDGTPQSGDVKIDSVEADATILLEYDVKAVEDPEKPDHGNYSFVKKPNTKKVKPGETVVYTFSKFGNDWDFPLEKYSITDRPDKGLDFVSAELPAFKNGSDVTYDVLYYTNKNGVRTLGSGLSAASAQSIKAPTLAAGEHITAISFEFGTVPAGFAQGNTLTMTFKVWDNPPSKTLTNVGLLGYKVDDEYLEFIIGGDGTTITIDGYFGTPKTGDDSNMILWILLLAASGAALAGIPLVMRKRRRKAKHYRNG